jgi:hypothetical protein
VDTAESVTFQKGLGWEIFVMSPGGDFHMASHRIGLYHHSSLLGGGNVAAAGMMRVSGGAIQELNNHSGHYAPEDKHVRNVLKRLSQAGNSLNFDLEIAGANPFRGRAADYWKPQDQGGQGGQVTYDRHRTAQILSHFNNTLGRNRVDQAFTSAGWTVTRPNPKSVNIAKPDGTIPSFEEIQVQLTTHFAAEQQPPATVTQKD